MRKPLLALCVSVLAAVALALPARAQFSGGGHDETTENFTSATSWNAAAGQPATPGTVPGGITGTHLLITEVGVRGLNSATVGDSTEFIEIYNPTSSSVDLSHFYISDANGYWALPDNGKVDLGAVITDFAFKFPNNSFIGPGQTKVIAVDGGRYRRGTGVNASFMLFYTGGNTNAMRMVDVGANKGVNYPGFGSLTNGGEFIWLFYWDGTSDLVCDVDMVYWGTPLGSNAPLLKTAATCLDGGDPDPTLSCYLNDAGNPAGSLGMGLGPLPADGAGTRQRIGPETELVTSGGNGCMPCPAISLSPGSLPGAMLNHPYHEILTPSAGTPPFVFTATNGTLPPGMKLSGSGTILYGCDPNGAIFTIDLVTGVGTATGIYAPIGSATEIEHDFVSGATFVQALGLSGQRFDIQTGATLGPAVYDGGSFQGLEYVGGTLYGTSVDSSGGVSTLNVLDPTTGARTVIGPTGRGPISGLAYDAGSSTMYGIDDGSGGLGSLLTLSLTTGAATAVGPTGITAGSLEFGPDGRLYAGGDAGNGGRLYRIDRTTGAATFVGSTGFFAVTGLTLGPGGAGAEGVISGIPTVAASYTFTVIGADAYGCSGNIDYKLDVNCSPLTISPTTLPPAIVGNLVNDSLTAEGAPPLTFEVTAGSLPPGVALYSNYSYALIYGVPTATGSSPFTVRVTDASGCHGSIDYKLDVQCRTLVLSPATLPSAPYGAPYGVTLTSDGKPPVVFDQKGGSLPPGLNLDPAGTIAGTPTATGSFGFTIGATDSNGCRGTRDYKITVIVCPPITISPATLPPGTVKVPYHQILTPSDGTPPFVFTAKESLPPGLSLSGTGTVLYGCDPNGAIFTVDLATGAGTFRGYYAPTYNATEIEHDFLTGQAFVQGRDGSFYGQRFDIQTGAALGPAVSDGASFQGLEYVGSTLYGTSVTFSGGPSTLGTLDPVTGATIAIGPTGRGPVSGLAYDAGSGTMYGIDGGGAQHGPGNLLTLNLTTGAATVIGPTGVATGSLEFGPDGNLYAGGDASNGGRLYRIDRLTGAATLVGPTGFYAVTGLTLGTGGPGPTGVLSGIPTAVGSFTFQLNVTDAIGCHGSVGYKLDVNCPPLTISPTTLPPAIVGNLVNDTLTAEGAPPLAFEVTAGSLPPGVTLYSNYSYAQVYGVPTATGSFPFTVRVTDSHSCHGSIDYKLDVQCRTLVLSPATLPNAPYGEPYGVTLTSDGKPPVVFDQKGGSLPPGLNLDPAGTIAGTPTATGSFGFTIGATDSNGCRGTRDYKITVVVCPPITISPPTLPPGTVKVPYHQILTPSDGTPPFVFTAKDSLPPGLILSGTGTVLYGCDPNGAIFTVDLATGAGTFRGYYAPTYNATEIEHDFLTGEAFVQGRDGTFYGQRFDIQSGAALGPTVSDGASFQGLEYVGSTLYGTSVTFSGGPSTLGTLDPVTGATIAIGPTGRGPVSGLAYDAGSGTMYGIDGGGRYGPGNLLTLDLSTGAATIVGPTGITAGSLEFGPDGNLYAGGDGLDGGRLYRVDRTTGAATLVGPTGFYAVTGLTLGTGGPGPTGVLSGIPLLGGSFPISVNVTDANGCHGSIEYKLVLSCPALALSPDFLPPGQVKDHYDQTVAVIGGSPPYSSFVNGSLPPGLSLSGGDSLRISGVLTTEGKFTFTIGVLDHNGCFGEREYSITVSCPAITLNPDVLPDGITEKQYSQILTPKAGSPPFTVVVKGGALPPGLSIKEQPVVFAGVRARAGARPVAARSVGMGSRPRTAVSEPLTGIAQPAGSVRNSLTPALNDSTKGPRILFALADFDSPNYRAAIASLIGGTVDFFQCSSTLGGTTPSPELLASYDCVFTKPDYTYEDRVLMGDRLADYVDAGGKVILGVFSALDENVFPGFALQGRIMTPAYCPVVAVAGSNPFSRGDYAGDGTTCIHEGVAAYGSNYHDQLALQGGGAVDGHYLQDGSIAHAYRPDGRVIYSNGHGDSTAYGGTGDWPRLIANACACSPHPVQIVISGIPTEPGDFHFTLSFTDRNGCGGQQDFMIHVTDQATATLLSLFQARPVDDGLELRWQFGDPRMFSAVDLERGATALGPWTPVLGERRDENGVTVTLDRGVEAGRTYYYQLRATTAAGTSTVFGPFAQTAGQAIAEFALVSLAPNPSVGDMRIDFTVPRAAEVRLSVLDVLGREVAVLADGPRAPGRYQATWNGEDTRGRVPAGLYFVHFRTPAGSFVRRAVLTR